MKLTRREFVKTAAATGAVLSTGTIVVGCGNSVEPAPLLDVAVDDNWRVVLDDVTRYPDLSGLKGGALTLRLKPPANPVKPFPGGAPPTELLVAQTTRHQFAVTNSACPHQGCPLGFSPQDQLIECPCHSSRFRVVADDASPGTCPGDVVHPPAAKGSMQIYTSTFNRPTLTIDLLPVAATLTVDIDAVPALANAGGVAVVNTPTCTAVLLKRIDATTVKALDGTCTHMACAVAYNPAGGDFVCPCHGSTYDIDGNVTQGPSTRPLAPLAATLSGKIITVTLG